MGICLNKNLQKQDQKKKIKKINDLQLINQKERISQLVYLTPIKTSNMIHKKQTNIEDDYIFQQQLGRGGFGIVWKCIHKQTNFYRAIKKIKIKNKIIQQKEIQNLIQMVFIHHQDHPNVIKIYQFYQLQDYLYIVTQFLTGKQLFDKIVQEQRFTQNHAIQIMHQILSAVNYCHKQKIIHRLSFIIRDIKPQNLLFQNNQPHAKLKLIDFGTSLLIDQNELIHQRVGTTYYIAPEVLKKNYNYKCDIWSCGIIFFMLLSGQPPFNGNTDQQILGKIQQGKYQFKSKLWKNISKEAIEVIKLIKQSLLEIKKFNVIIIVIKKLKRFQQAILSFIVNYFSSHQQKKELIKKFQAFDKDQDGKISYQDLMKAWKQAKGSFQAQEQIKQILQKMDLSKTGSINYSQFIYGTINKQELLVDQNLEKAFNLIDELKDGFIDISDLKNAMGKEIKENICKKMLEQVGQSSNPLLMKSIFQFIN